LVFLNNKRDVSDSMAAKPIYIEIEIQSDVEKIWEYTQQPQLHEQWDLRFSSITYNERLHEDDPQTFAYTTKVIPGIQVSGWGESKGTHEKESGEKISSLHFGTEQMISPIAEGKGYWKYVPHEKGVTFLTQYNYDVRFGAIGKLFDRLFRPLVGWATALSFDALKRWLETGESPKTQYRRFFAFYAVCFLFFFVWFYQGLVPKVIGQHPLEISMLTQLSPLTEVQASSAIIWIGIAEMVFGCCWLIPKLQKYLLQLQIIVFPLLTISAVFANSSVATAPFNVVTFNGALWILSVVGLLLTTQLPSARSSKRKRGNAS
jgi:hypothetical protein